MNYENNNTFKDLGIPSDESDDEEIFLTKRLTFYQIGMEILPEKPMDLLDTESMLKNKHGRNCNPFLARNSHIDMPRRQTLMPGIEMNKLLIKSESPEESRTRALMKEDCTQPLAKPMPTERQNNL